jgi:hypothetical protein
MLWISAKALHDNLSERTLKRYNADASSPVINAVHNAAGMLWKPMLWNKRSP